MKWAEPVCRCEPVPGRVVELTGSEARGEECGLKLEPALTTPEEDRQTVVAIAQRMAGM